jgi:alkanesulfonate monooxygenase SsuD/methylene tetrahydromethanopterin reductase-like flavin-dependent oxidoreductase (luciferase family)
MNLRLSIVDQLPIISGHAPARAVVGDSHPVRERLLQLREQFDADELMMLTITGVYASRLRSYELLVREFESQ